jgi:hypothetical protein
MRALIMNEMVRNLLAVKRIAAKNIVVFDKTLLSAGLCCPL